MLGMETLLRALLLVLAPCAGPGEPTDQDAAPAAPPQAGRDAGQGEQPVVVEAELIELSGDRTDAEGNRSGWRFAISDAALAAILAAVGGASVLGYQKVQRRRRARGS